MSMDWTLRGKLIEQPQFIKKSSIKLRMLTTESGFDFLYRIEFYKAADFKAFEN